MEKRLNIIGLCLLVVGILLQSIDRLSFVGMGLVIISLGLFMCSLLVIRSKKKIIEEGDKNGYI